MYQLVHSGLNLGIHVPKEENHVFFSGRAVALKPKAYLGMRRSRVEGTDEVPQLPEKNEAWKSPWNHSVATVEGRNENHRRTTTAGSGLVTRSQNMTGPNVQTGATAETVSAIQLDTEQIEAVPQFSPEAPVVEAELTQRLDEIKNYSVIQKDPNLVLMELEIAKLPLHERMAFDTAMRLNRDYAFDPVLWNRFLQSETNNNDHKRAALRLMRNFQTKLDLFGESHLTQDIVQDDLEYESLYNIHMGCSYPCTEREDRNVWVWRMNEIHMCTQIKGRVCRVFYEIMTFFKEKRRQNKPLSLVIWSAYPPQEMRSSPLTPIDIDALENLPAFFFSLPVILDTVHVCYSTVPWHPIVRSLQAMAARLDQTITVHGHYGDRLKCTKELETHNIPPSMVAGDVYELNPRDNEMEYSPSPVALQFVETVQRWRIHEREMFDIGSKVVGFPSKHDVLFDPKQNHGSIHSLHPGNVELMRLVSTRCTEYAPASEAGREKLCQDIIDATHATSGRFLMRSAGGWIQDTNAKERIVQLLKKTVSVDSEMSTTRPPASPSHLQQPPSDIDIVHGVEFDSKYLGNVRLLELVEMSREGVGAALPDLEKIARIAESIILKLRSTGARCLKEHGNEWVTDTLIMAKVIRLLMIQCRANAATHTLSEEPYSPEMELNNRGSKPESSSVSNTSSSSSFPRKKGRSLVARVSPATTHDSDDSQLHHKVSTSRDQNGMLHSKN